jgi:hypothetical protein
VLYCWEPVRAKLGNEEVETTVADAWIDYVERYPEKHDEASGNICSSCQYSTNFVHDVGRDVHKRWKDYVRRLVQMPESVVDSFLSLSYADLSVSITQLALCDICTCCPFRKNKPLEVIKKETVLAKKIRERILFDV